MERNFSSTMEMYGDEIRNLVCNLTSIAERYYAGKIKQELALDQIRMIVQQPALIDSIQPHISSSDHFLLTRSVHMEFRKLSIEDMNELFQSLTLIFIRLLDRHDAEISAVQASRLGLQAAR